MFENTFTGIFIIHQSRQSKMCVLRLCPFQGRNDMFEYHLKQKHEMQSSKDPMLKFYQHAFTQQIVQIDPVLFLIPFAPRFQVIREIPALCTLTPTSKSTVS
jgi:hypothetical protein